MCLCSKQPSIFSFYALPSGGKLKGVVVHEYLSLIENTKQDCFTYLLISLQRSTKQYNP